MANVVKTYLKFFGNSVFSQQIRFHPRWTHRRPIKVYTPDEYEKVEHDGKRPKENAKNVQQAVDSPHSNETSPFEKFQGKKIKWKHENDQTEPLKYNIKPKKKSKPLLANTQKQSKTTTDMLETVIDGDGNFIYTKMADNDHRVGTILTEVKSKNEKMKKELILLEGKRLIKEALESGCILKYMIFSHKPDLDYLKPNLPKFGAKLYKMPYREMQMWSDLTTNPGIMGIFKIPNVENYEPKERVPFTVICDNVREPGNLGTILRICAGVACEKVMLTKGCVNLWDTKVIRSSMGAHFKLQIHKNVEWDTIKSGLENAAVYIADNRILSEIVDQADHNNLETLLSSIPLLPYYAVDFKKSSKIVLVIGGETHGISKISYELTASCNGARLNIPLANGIESLNVGAALAIIAFEIKKQLLRAK